MEKEDIKKSLFEYIQVIIITIIVTFGILYFVQISRVVGASMEPTYHNGNIVLVDKIFYKRDKPSHDDIVVVDYHVAEGEDQIIKRVVGIPGDYIECKDNKLYRNGKLLKEDYIKEPMVWKDFAYNIPKGKIFIMGDNRNNSVDSRMIGTVDFDEEVIGRVFFKVF